MTVRTRTGPQARNIKISKIIIICLNHRFWGGEINNLFGGIRGVECIKEPEVLF